MKDENCSKLKDRVKAAEFLSDYSISLRRAKLRAFSTMYKLTRYCLTALSETPSD